MSPTYKLFGQIAVDNKFVTQQQLDEALHKQQTTMANRKVGEILVRLGNLSRSHIYELLSEQMGIPVVRLSDREIPERIRSMIEGSVATLYKVVPIEERGDALVLAIEDPTNMNHLDNLTRLLERPVEPVISTKEEISDALDKYYGLKQQTVETMLSTVSSASSVSTLSSMSNMSSLDSSLSSLGSMSASEMSMSSISMDDSNIDTSGITTDGDDEGDADKPVVKPELPNFG